MAKPSTVTPTVKVLPNPYCAVDQDGVPQGVVGLPGTRRYIGARIDETLTAETGKVRFFFPDFPNREIELPLEGLVANAVRDGSLLVTTIEDARKVGIPEKKFLPPEQVLQDERAKALKRYVAIVGEGGTIEDVPTRRIIDVREDEANATTELAAESAEKPTVGEKATADGSDTVTDGDRPTDEKPAAEVKPGVAGGSKAARNALVGTTKKGETVLSGPTNDPHVVIARSAEKE